MKKEFEAGFLGVNEKAIKTGLKKLSAKKIIPRRLMRRYIFETAEMKKTHSWLRVRDEGDCITVTLKRVSNPTKIGGKQEIEVQVNDFEQTRKLFEGLGFPVTNYQESYRETWQLGRCRIEFDWWPDLPIFLEIEGPDKKSVERLAARLHLDVGQAWFGTIGHVYEKVLGRDIKKEKRLVFKK